MEGKSPEIIISEKSEPTDNGFSEKRAARLLEGVQKDNAQVRKKRPVVAPARIIRLPMVKRKRQSLSKKVVSRRDAI